MIPRDVVVVVLRGLSFCLTPLQSGSVVVMVVIMMTPAVGAAVGLVFVMLAVMVHTVTIAVLVKVTVVMIDAVIKTVIMVAALIISLGWDGFLGVERGSFALWRRAVLPHLVDEEDFGHVVDDEHLSPVRDWLGLGTTEMNVHDEDGEGGGGCDHSHSGNVVLPLRRKERKELIVLGVLDKLVSKCIN